MKTQTNTAKHTQGKLVVAGCTLYQADDWKDGHNYGAEQVARTWRELDDSNESQDYDHDNANAERIALCWNQHDQLIAQRDALKEALLGVLGLADNENLYREWQAEFDKADAAIALCEPKDKEGVQA